MTTVTVLNRQVEDYCAMYVFCTAYIASHPYEKLCTFRAYIVCNKIMLVF